MNVSSLNPQELQFLQNNFVAYDPITRRSNQNFSTLANFRVVLIGETHHSYQLQQLQNRLFEILLRVWDEKETCCTLLEGLALGEIVPRDKVPHLKNLPERVAIHGSDCRYDTWNQTLFPTFLSYGDRVITMSYQRMSILKEAIKGIAETLSEGYRNKEVAPTGSTVTITPRIFLKIHEFRETIRKQNEQLINLRNEMETWGLKNPRAKDLERVGLEISEKALEKTIINSCQSFDRVVAIWGVNHFHFANEMSENLKKLNISHIVLQPRKEQMKSSKLEHQWRMFTNPYGQIGLTIHQDGRPFTVPLTIPKECIPMFSSVFRKRIFINESTTPVFPKLTINRETLLEKLSKKLSVTFSGLTHIKFDGVDPKIFKTLSDLYDRNERPQNPKESLINRMVELAKSAISDLTLANGIYLTSISYEGCLLANRRGERISLLSENSFTLNFNKVNLMIPAAKLFQNMQRHESYQFILKNPQTLGFVNINPEDLKKLQTIPDYFMFWVNQQAPHGFQVQLKGNPQLFFLEKFERGSNRMILELSTPSILILELSPEKSSAVASSSSSIG